MLKTTTEERKTKISKEIFGVLKSTSNSTPTKCHHVSRHVASECACTCTTMSPHGPRRETKKIKINQQPLGRTCFVMGLTGGGTIVATMQLETYPRSNARFKHKSSFSTGWKPSFVIATIPVRSYA